MKNLNLSPLYLIDSYALIYRYYFAYLSRPLTNNSGKNVSALYGFGRSIVSLLNDEAPLANKKENSDNKKKVKYLAAVFDSRTLTFRHEMYPDYKANRQKTPDDLHEQVPLVEEFLNALGIKCLKVDGFEADDIIATLVKKCKEEKRDCYIISSDKDLLQLVGNGIYELSQSKSGKNEEPSTASNHSWEIIGPDEVKTKWGVEPEKILDLLSLTGDTSDNVPGVKGIGEKGAAKLIARYGTLDAIYKNIAAIEGSIGKKLAEGKESAYFSKSLITLRYDVPLPIYDIDELSIENIDRKAGAKVLIREGIRHYVKQLDNNENAAVSSQKTVKRSTDEKHETNQNETEENETALNGRGIYKTILDIEELKKILEQAKKQKFIALDFETDSLDAWNSNPVGISIALKPKQAYYVPVAPHGVINTSVNSGNAIIFSMEASTKESAKESEKDQPSGGYYIDPEKVKGLLSPLFADSEMTIMAHNAKFDYKVNRGWGIKRWKCKIWDTMVAAWITDPQRINYSLDSLISVIFNYTPIKYADIVPKGACFNVVSLETATRYSGEDADFCLRLKYYLEPILINTESLSLFENLEMPLLPILAEMEGEGIMIKPDVLINYGKELGEKLDKIQDETWKTVGHEFNLSSTKQLQDVLFVERKLTPVKTTKTGYSTDAEVLEELAREDPVAAMIHNHRLLSKLKSTYVDTLAEMADDNKRLHTNFIQTGTATGRLSSREPNLQNIPIRTEEGRRIREAFTAKPGHLLVSADYSQIELVILAHFSRDENLINAFTEGRDVHARTASLIFGIEENEVNGEQRRMAKTINFGVIYGMSAFRLANDLGISRTEAVKFISAYFNTYSGVRRFIDETIKKTEQCGYVTTISGRRRYIPTINSPNKTEKSAAERIAVNTPIQGSASDIVKTAMLKLDSKLRLSKSKARLLLQVHDELILECPEDEADDTAKLVRTEMEQAAVLSVPLRVTVETGDNWGGFH